LAVLQKANARKKENKIEIKQEEQAMTKKTAPLSAGLVATKGQATVGSDATPRQPEAPTKSSSSSAPLNFKVSAEFRRRFRQCAAGADLKLNELLRQALDAWEEKHSKR
jgi:uncharacterized glyoxalase superfamily protein PhnB